MIWQTIYNVWDSALSALCRFPFQLRKSELLKRANACLYSLLLSPLIIKETQIALPNLNLLFLFHPGLREQMKWNTYTWTNPLLIPKWLNLDCRWWIYNFWRHRECKQAISKFLQQWLLWLSKFQNIQILAFSVSSESHWQLTTIHANTFLFTSLHCWT